MDACDPDGPEPDDAVAQERRHLELRPLPDGTWRLEGRLTATVGVQLNAVLGPLAKPQPLRLDEETGTFDAPDLRRHGQRMHDALDSAALGCCAVATCRPAVGCRPAS